MATRQKFENLRKSINIGKVFIKNRIALAPMGDIHQFFDKATGKVNRRWVDYMLERAKGGVGLLIPSVFKIANEVLPYAEKGVTDWMVFRRESIRDYAELARCAHAYGATIFFQLSPGRGRVILRKEAYEDKEFAPVSPSDNQVLFRQDVRCRPLTVVEIGEIVKAFGDSAEILANCGIDGIELHAHEGYLLDEFATALWNRRTDKYGGDLERRLTLAIEILKAIKNRAGDDFPVTYRYGVKHFIKGPGKSALHVDEREMGRDIDESIQIAKILEKAGFDGLHVDTGCYESSYWAHPPIYMPHGFNLELTSQVKKEVKIPVIIAGRLDIPELAENIIAEGKADMIAIGRGLLADPYWPKKVFENRVEDIVPCIGCHDLMYKSETDQFTTCAVNPFCGSEKIFSLQSAKKSRKILIAGGGVGGMQAAIIARERGHNVFLFEKTENLGGHLIEASVPEFKKDIKRLLDYYKIRLNKLKVNVKFKITVTPEFIREEDPDVVIIATGSDSIVPNISGVEKSMVVTCIDLLLGRKEAQNRVVVIGGGLEGSETALWLAKQGRKVTIVEVLPQIVTGIHRANRDMLLDLLEDSAVEVLINLKIQEITNNGVVCIDKKLNAMKRIDADTVVLAVGLKSNKELYNSLARDSREIYEIGDCKEPRKIGDAIWEATMLALNI
jgi:2-enoate reductase